MLLPSSKITTEGAGIDWESLCRAVERDPNVPKADRVLEIVRTLPDTVLDAHGQWVGGRKHELMRLNAGRTWNYLMENVYPTLRSANAKVMCVVSVPELQPVPVETEADTVEVIEVVMEASAEEPVVQHVYEKYPVIALRSNLLLPLLNVGVEIPVAKHWSLGADYYYPWIWPSKSNKNCFELTFISAEARYWFNANRHRQLADKNYLTGHSIAAYGAWGYYDFERNYHGHQGHGWSAGLDYVYALPIAKGLFHLEFQLAVGVVWSRNVQPYNVYYEGGNLIREPGIRKNFFYFGPTKVGVSLVLPINRKVQLPTPVQP